MAEPFRLSISSGGCVRILQILFIGISEEIKEAQDGGAIQAYYFQRRMCKDSANPVLWHKRRII